LSRTMIRWLILAAVILLLPYPMARAQEHMHGNKPIDAEVGKFYSTMAAAGQSDDLMLQSA
jgi:hypothetical protein